MHPEHLRRLDYLRKPLPDAHPNRSSRRDRGPEPSARASGEATFRFYAELNDFLPRERQGRDLSYGFNDHPAVKDAIEAQGVPHAEVELILADGDPVGFDHQLRAGQRFAVYPVFESFDVTPLLRLRPEPLRRNRFVVDVNLGKLARGLRLLGFDTLYRNDFADREVVDVAAREHRIVLTRDRRLLHHKAVTHGYWVRNVDPARQLVEVVRRFQLEADIRPFRRCLTCNGDITAVAKQDVLEQLPAKTRRHYHDFYRCTRCGKVYWEGPHVARLESTVRRLRDDVARAAGEPGPERPP